MKPVDQTKYGLHDGDCFTACVASILELPIDAVPAFVRWGDAWLTCFAGWLASLGLAATRCVAMDGSPPPPGYSIAGGPSQRFAGRIHACVAWSGVVVHDPHPSRDGLPSGIHDYVVIHGLGGEPLWFNGVG